jgi:four helix bundle protein
VSRGTKRKKESGVGGRVSQQGLESFGAYQKAWQLFDLVAADMETVKTNPLCYRLVSQPMGSADSICANIEESYGRLSRIKYVRLLDIARGSARETRGATSGCIIG